LITGASKGLGAAFAHQCAQRGLNTVLVARNEDLLKEQALAIRETCGVSTQTIALDLSRPDILDVISPVIDPLEVGLLINNAGNTEVRPFFEHTLEQLLDQLHLNARAALILAYHLGRRMVSRRRGGIVFVSSASAMNGTAFVANYAGTKAYNLILGESLWVELQSRGVDVLGFMPGSTESPGWYRNRPKPVAWVPVMKAEDAVTEALDAIGRRPSWIAGRFNRMGYFFLARLLSRRRAITTVSKTMTDVFGPFPDPG
jgi:short-subunit dehydrogenase